MAAYNTNPFFRRSYLDGAIRGLKRMRPLEHASDKNTTKYYKPVRSRQEEVS